MNVYFYSYTITGLVLFALVVVLRVIEWICPKIKYMSTSSIISFVLVLMLILFKCYIPYTSKGLLYHFGITIVYLLVYLPFLITGVIGELWGRGGYTIIEEPVWQCIFFAISFVFYTLLIFIVVKIIMNLKKRSAPQNVSAHTK
jgi:hypothetical protein